MKPMPPVLLLLLSMAVLAGCAEQQTEEPGLIRGTVVFGGSHQVARGEALNGTLLMLDGQLVLEAGARVDGAVYMLGGALEMNGAVAGNITMLGGALTLGPGAIIGGDLEIGGGTVNRSPAATIGGEVVSGPQVPSLEVSDTRSTVERVLRLVIEAVLVGGVAFVLVRFQPRQVLRVAEAATRHPLVSGAMGILVGVVGLVLLVLIAFTIFLIPVALLGLVVLGMAVVYGWIAFGTAVGRWLVRWRQWAVRPATSAFLGTILFMLGVDVISLIPLAGDLIAILVTTVGFGAVLVTRFGLRRFVPVTETTDEFTA